MLRKASYLACASLFSFLLLSCGGGSSSNSSTSNNSPTPGASAPPPASGGSGSSSGGSSGTSGGSGGGTGSAGGGSATATAHFAYVYNASGSTIDGFTVNQSNGSISPMFGSPFAAPPSGTGLAATGSYLYAAGGAPGATGVTSYSIAADGRLAPSGSIATSDTVRYNLYVHSSGRYLYAATIGGDILGFQIVAPGKLVAMSGLPGSVGPDISMTLSPDGKWAFVSYQQTSNGGAHILTYSVDSSTGKWSGPVVYSGSPVGVGNPPPVAGNQ